LVDHVFLLFLKKEQLAKKKCVFILGVKIIGVLTFVSGIAYSEETITFVLASWDERAFKNEKHL
jgi:hypothetical protein